MPEPLLTRRNINRLLQAEIEWLHARMDGLTGASGSACDSLRVESISAFRCNSPDFPDANRVIGLCVGQGDFIGPIIRWYSAAGVECRFEVSPWSMAPSLGQALSRAGFVQTSFLATLGAAGSVAACEPACTVRRIDSAAAASEAANALARWQDARSEEYDVARHRLLNKSPPPGWQFYLAEHDGEPVGFASLYKQGDVTVLADAFTHPRAQRKGVHAALVQRRLAEADTAVTIATVPLLSTSRRNLERCGMRLTAMRAIWTKMPADDSQPQGPPPATPDGHPAT